jgi:zinc finger-containing ubiquitin peptidase 1
MAWQCGHCTLLNDGPGASCDACGLPRPESVTVDLTGGSPVAPQQQQQQLFPETGSIGIGGGGDLDRCSYDAECRRRDPVHFASTLHLSDWSCPACTTINSGPEARCGTCEGYRGPPLDSKSATPAAGEAGGGFLDDFAGLLDEEDMVVPRGGRCPVQTCRIELSAEEYAEHIQIHVAAGDDVDGDAELARLRKRYGLDPDPENASYVQQYEKRLEAQVAKGKMTRVTADSKLAEMRASLEQGESKATTGIIPHVANALCWIHRNDGRQRLTGAGGSAAASAPSSGQLELASADGNLVAAKAPQNAFGRGTSWVLCDTTVMHCGGDFGDSGWGCGYRNIQMQAAYLLNCGGATQERYRSTIFDKNGSLPTVPKVQEWLEAAWRAGFDRDGASQLEHYISNTKKLIGATECSAVLRSFGVKAHVCDFRAPKLPEDEFERLRQQAELDAHRDNARHPGRKKQKKPKWISPYAPCTEVADFCWRFFAARQPTPAVDASSDAGARTFCPPLYLQHEGHSRTGLFCFLFVFLLSWSGSSLFLAWFCFARFLFLFLARRKFAVVCVFPPARIGLTLIAVVGAERNLKSGEITLLIFDPSSPGASLLQAVRDKRRLQQLRRGTHTLNRGKYQIVWVEEGLAEGSEQDLLRVIEGEDKADAWRRPRRDNDGSSTKVEI